MSGIAPWNVMLGGWNLGFGTATIGEARWALVNLSVGIIVLWIGMFGRGGVYAR